MKNRRDFLRNTLGLGAGLAAAPRLFAAPLERGAEMDMKRMGHATQHSSSRIVSVETPDVPQLPWRMDSTAGFLGKRARAKRSSVTCNFPGGIASSLWSNLYFT